MPTFKKIERLCSKKDIQLLYTKGGNKLIYPYRIYWRETIFKSPYPARIVITVPKRNFKKAVDRNRIKRLIREAYRLNKESFYSELTKEHKQVDILFIYISNDIFTFQDAEKSMKKIFAYLCGEITKF